MLSKFFVIACLPLLTACVHTGSRNKIEAPATNIQAVSPAWLITPGKGIGNTHLNEDLDSVMAKLGRPDKSDAAMGASFHTWYAKHDTTAYQTDIYAHHNYDGRHDAISYVKVIRITSPAFKTAENLHTGLAVQDMARHFKLNHVATYSKGTNSLKIYDDRQSGIAFEIGKNGKCSGILVHLPGDSNLTYLSMHPDMRRTDL